MDKWMFLQIRHRKVGGLSTDLPFVARYVDVDQPSAICAMILPGRILDKASVERRLAGDLGALELSEELDDGSALRGLEALLVKQRLPILPKFYVLLRLYELPVLKSYHVFVNTYVCS